MKPIWNMGCNRVVTVLVGDVHADVCVCANCSVTAPP
jgi:hypothetical protein